MEQGWPGGSCVQTKKDAWPEGCDLCGTAATKFYINGLTERKIAEIMSWEEDTSPASSAATSVAPVRSIGRCLIADRLL